MTRIQKAARMEMQKCGICHKTRWEHSGKLIVDHRFVVESRRARWRITDGFRLRKVA